MPLIPTDYPPESNFVPPEGTLGAKYVIVGEAPGYEETQQKRFFVGASGNLLTDLLENVGILRKRCYITNVIKEKPKGNNISSYIRFNTKGEATLSKAALDYMNQLKEELSKTTANVIVAVGNIALWALTGKTGILQYRGSVLESTLLPGRKVIPIIHPSAALRLFIYARYIHLDLFKVLSESEFPEIRRIERNLKVFPTYTESILYLRDIEKNCSSIGCDIETSRSTHEVTHISFSKSKTDAISIQFFKNGKNFFTMEEEANIWFLIAKILENPDKEIIIQNAAFDAWYLFRKYGIVINNIHDTMIAMRIAFPDFRSGLDFLCSVYTDVPYYKDDGKDHTVIGNEIAFAEYSARDSVVLPEIMNHLEDDLKKQNNYKHFRERCELIEPLIFMQEHGFLVNTKGIKEEKIRAQSRLRELEEEFRTTVGIKDISLTSTQQLQNYFYITLGIRPFTKTSVKKDGSKTQSDTLDEKALQRIGVGTKSRKPRPEAFLILEHRKLSKLDSTYYDLSDIDSDNRMRCSFHPVGAKTGRLSSSENVFGTGMNMQNQPHSMRKFFLADPGHILFDVDLAQAEWRIVAYLSMDYNMIDVLEKGGDIHAKTAANLFMLREDQISDKPGSAPNVGNGEQSQRFWGKKMNHATNYDASANELSLQFYIPIHQAKELRQRYLNGYPGIEMTFWAGIRRQIDKNRTITDLFGKSITYRDRLADVYKSAYNYIPQSSVGYIINEWGLKRMYFDQDLFKDFKLLLQVHDSLVFQVRTENVPKIVHGLNVLKSSLEQEITYNGQTFHIPADFKFGLNWGKKDEENKRGLRDLKLDGTEVDQLNKFIKENEDG